MGKCGKRLYQEWVHRSPDGTETTARSLREAIDMAAKDGGSYRRRSVRR